MKILVAGAGPAGLYFSYLAKRQHPDWQIRVVEQNPADSTFGFGVVFSDRALEFLRDDDAETCERITPQMEMWTDLVVAHRGTPVRIDGIGFAAIGRLKFLQLLQKQLASVDIIPEFTKTLSSKNELQGYDLVVAADGVNSFVRRAHGDAFGTTVRNLTNKFGWFGTTKRFDTLTQTFVENQHGTFNAHHYRHAPAMSTFVVECDAATWQRAGFATMNEAETLKYCETVFAQTLGGHRLVSNKSVWRNFPNLRNARWSSGNVVLIGDALRTAHFSIGSGTRLAMEDAIALAKALRTEANIDKALKSFEAARRPIVEKLVAAADASGDWYERFPEHMRLAPRDFAGRFPPRVRAKELWRVPEPYLAEAQDDATLLAIRAQERAGLDIITDGEIRRESYSNRFATALEGIDIDHPGSALDRSGHPNPVPRIVGRIRRKHPVEVDDLKFLKRHTNRQVKITVPGPFTMSQQAQNDFYQSVEEAATDYAAAVNEEIRDLFAAGADIVQIDEPYMQARPEKAREYGLKALNRALEGVDGTTAVHICFGYAAIIHSRPSGYSFLPELAGCSCRQVSIETAQSRLDCAVLAKLQGKKIMVGCLDLSDMAVDTPQQVADRIRKALRFVKKEDVIVAPDCGMKYLPREVAFGKMKAMVEGAKILRTEVV